MSVPTTIKPKDPVLNEDFTLDSPAFVDPAPTEPVFAVAAPVAPAPVNDPVNHPAHYCRNGIETLDVIEAWELDYCLGNAVKYISRAGYKDPAKHIEDLEKARFYLDREINNLKAKL